MVRKALKLAGAAGISAVVAGCATNAPQDTWQPKGPNSKLIDDLQQPVFAVAGIIGLIVAVAVVYTMIKYRDRGQPIPEQTHGKPALEITLTIIPALILAVVSVFTFGAIFKLAKTDDTEMIINVTGQQWWWEYDYPVQNDFGITQPIISSGQLVMPVGTKVLLRETSRDVIHSYWIPALNGKRDAVPGRIHTLRLEADEPGIYAGQCTEFCGLSHANMRMEAVALSKEDFAKWVANQQAPYVAPAKDTLAKQGEEVFLNQCVRCHQVNGLTRADGTPAIAAPDENVWSGAAPNLSHLMSRNTFAGAMFNLLSKQCRDEVWNAPSDVVGAKYLVGVTEQCLNQKDLRAWLRNAPEVKPMYANPADLAVSNGKYRGMPYLALSEDDINKLVAYLITLK
ncbi:MAG: cytochrome c oxidase subunit II [Actinomycetota bacterium]|nr:cytochrome c oxidase subunit II [Actinomycetota bacterium]MDA3004757.1 cytochrome c oxidase subunit II [Actinomycetota bacterium]